MLMPFLEDAMAIVTDLFHAHPARLETALALICRPCSVTERASARSCSTSSAMPGRFAEPASFALRPWPRMVRFTSRLQTRGRAFPADRLPYIFDEFYQVDSSLNARTRGGGPGPGDQQTLRGGTRGKISVESHPGVGSRFTFSLPVERLEDPGDGR